MAFRFRLYHENGEDIGDFDTGTLAWVSATVFGTDHHRFRVMNVIEHADLGSKDYCGVLVVTPLELAEPVSERSAGVGKLLRQAGSEAWGRDGRGLDRAVPQADHGVPAPREGGSEQH